jgi:MFS family permease
VTPELAGADRAEAVRAAARAWQRAGVIDAAALAAIEGRFPDDRVRVGPVFRVLLFLFTLLAIGGGCGFVAFSLASVLGGGSHEGLLAGLALVAGLALAALTELQIGSLRRRQGGAEAATSLAAIGLLLGAAAWVLFSPAALDRSAGLPLLCLIAAALAGAAAWRWGYPLYAGAATTALFVLLAHLPLGRVLWIAAPLATAPALLRLAESPRLPPAHRSSATAALVVALAALYLAVHAGSWDSQLVESIGSRKLSPPPQDDWRWWSAVAATALMPVLLFAGGLRRRRPALLAAGAGAAVASLVTLDRYVDLGPAWAVLIVAGALGIAAALALWRYLDSGPDAERRGFTAAPLFADPGRQGMLEAGAALLTLPAEARAAAGEPRFEGGGGRSGGGGATGEF